MPIISQTSKRPHGQRLLLFYPFSNDRENHCQVTINYNPALRNQQCGAKQQRRNPTGDPVG
jgi:hypothetical protein